MMFAILRERGDCQELGIKPACHPLKLLSTSNCSLDGWLVGLGWAVFVLVLVWFGVFVVSESWG